LQLLSTQTGALTSTGALAAVAGSTETAPSLLEDVAVVVPLDWVAELPDGVPATVIGVFALTGALTAVVGLTVAVPGTGEVPARALACPTVSAASTASDAQIERLMVLLFFRW